MNKRRQLLKWQQQGLIKNEDVDRAFDTSDANKSSLQWYDFISKGLILLGLIAFAIGVIFFFAYNWDEMSKLTKFGLIQGLIITSSIAFTQVKLSSHLSTALLFFLSLLIGALLALFGQTYQTGKDPWQLFFLWTVFITPLAFVSKSSGVWILWLVLLNLTILLFMQTSGFFGYVFLKTNTIIVFTGVNTLASLLFYVLLKPNNTNEKPLAFYVALLATFYSLTWLVIYTIFDERVYDFYLLVYLVSMAIIYFLFRVKSIDVLILSAWCFSLIVFTMAIAIRFFANNFNSLVFLIMSILLISLSTLATRWLMARVKESHGEAS